MFEYYVLNYDFNGRKIEMFNIFWNHWVNSETEKMIKKYLRSPKKFKYERYNKETLYGFDALCENFRIVLMSEEWSRCEYEIAVGGMFTPELYEIINEIDREKIDTSKTYDIIKEKARKADRLEKWDCFEQAEKNIPMIMHECIYQYKKYKKYKGDEQ